MVPSGNLNEVIGAPQSKSDFRSLPIDINGGLLPLRYLKIDKADQSKTALPSIATMSLGCTVGCPGAVGLSLMTTKIQPTSDLGFLRSCSRLAVGIVGVHFSGLRRTPEWAVTSTLDDCKHGAETQFSIVLRQFHRVCVSEGSLANKICPWANAYQLAHLRDQFVLYSHQGRVPSKLTIGTDNTPKETKNSTFLAGMLWLLCQATHLEQLELEFPLVGHSHCDLDRFFSRVIVTWTQSNCDATMMSWKENHVVAFLPQFPVSPEPKQVALKGRSFMTLDELSQTVDAGLRAFEINWSHHGRLDRQLKVLACCCSGLIAAG